MPMHENLDHDLHLLIEDLVAEGLLKEKTAAYGIAQKVAHDGYDSLSADQASVYNKHVLPLVKQKQTAYKVNETLNSWPK